MVSPQNYPQLGTSAAGMAGTERRRRRRAPLVAAAVALGLLLTVAGLLAVFAGGTGEVLLQSCQPETVTYDDRGPYCLSVVEADVGRVSPLAPALPRHTELFVGRGPAAPAYGLRVEYTPPFETAGEDRQAYLEQVRVDWQPEGLTFREPSGRALFIPAGEFIGGR